MSYLTSHVIYGTCRLNIMNNDKILKECIWAAFFLLVQICLGWGLVHKYSKPKGTLIESCLHICFSLFPFFIIGAPQFIVVLLFLGHSWLKYKLFTWLKIKNIPKNPKDRIRWILPYKVMWNFGDFWHVYHIQTWKQCFQV